ncbi:triacylglycerol lipase [Xylariaceae sp. FL0016]|nr:triacylglycerol lipase [Xylariaceae sp. FL0016]
MATLKPDPEWQKVWAPFAEMPKPSVTTAQQLRYHNDASMRATFRYAPVEGIQDTKITIKSLDGSKIDVTRLVPASFDREDRAQRAVVFVFGGGLVSGSVDVFRPIAARIADRSGAQVFAVNYRLAPEHPAPAAVEDVYATVAWVQRYARSFGVDPARVVLWGTSAGGGIAAGASLMARDRGLSPPIAGQVLIYPKLDDRTTMTEEHPMWPWLTWSTNFNEIGWKAYLGLERAERNDDNVSIYAAPARAQDLSGLPATHIDVGTLDLYRDECTAFASKLAAANNNVEFHLYPGVPHAFEGVAPDIYWSKTMKSNQFRFLASI